MSSLSIGAVLPAKQASVLEYKAELGSRHQVGRDTF